MTVYGLQPLRRLRSDPLFGPQQHRRFGEDFIQGKPFHKLAEGVYTTEALVDLSRQVGVELPITQVLYGIVKLGKDPHAMLEQLFLRSTKAE